MNRNITPWPHSPAIIAYVEEYDSVGNMHDARYEVFLPPFAPVTVRGGYEAAVKVAQTMKTLRAVAAAEVQP